MNKKLLVLIISIILILLFSLNAYSNEIDKNKYNSAKVFAYTGTGFFYSGIGFEVLGNIFSTTYKYHMNKALFVSGIAFTLTGFTFESIIAPAFSITSIMKLRNSGLISIREFNNSILCFGFSWVGSALFAGGLLLMNSGIYKGKIGLTLIGTILTIVGIIPSLTLKGVATTIPLLSFQF